jgi:hypothetical protein
VERSHLKTQFAREILRAAEDEHVTRKGQYDAIAARLEDAIRTTNDAEENVKRREAALFAATGRQARPESRPQHPRRTGAPPQPPPPHRPPAPSHPRALPGDFLQTQPRQSNTSASASSSQNGSRPTSPPPPPTSHQRANGDVDFLSDGYEKGYIKEKSSSGGMSSWIPFGKKKKDKDKETPPQQQQQQQQPPPPPQQPTAPPLMRFPEVEEAPRDVSGLGASASSTSLNGTGGGGGVLRATSSGGGFSPREEPPDIFREDAPAETTTTTSPPSSSSPSRLRQPVPSPELRASVQTEDELARVAAVERSRREAAEARARARAAREQREAAARASSATAATEDPAIAAQAARAREFATAGSSGSLTGEISPPALADFADFDSAAAAGASGFSGGGSPGVDVADAAPAPASQPEPEGPPSVNTAHDLARAAMRHDVEPLLPRAHEPRAGLTEHQRRLGPPAGEFCLPRFCSPRCVAASCAAFIRACGSNPDAEIDLADVGGITRQLRKITIRNHPDRNSVARVGELKSAMATVLTQQATFLESMLEDHEYVAVRVGVDTSALAGTNGGDAGPPSVGSTSVVLNRVHLASTAEQLRDLVVEERPELAEARDRLAVGMTRAPGLPETRLHFGHGAGAVTLRELEVDRETVFRVWAQTEAEMEWEMFSR